MKTLYLIRHAKSSWKNEKLSDFDRPLNNRGLRDAPFMGQRLANYRVSPGIILSSPAMRAIETATTIASEVGYPKDAIQRITSLYLASLNTLLETVNEIDDKHESAFIFGHNPGMTMFANFLTTYAIDNVPTCGVVCVLFEVDSWKDVAENRGSLSFFDYPRRHLI
ncbi:MAG: SixA phosphatase family protein [Calditrichia bacterium]